MITVRTFDVNTGRATITAAKSEGNKVVICGNNAEGWAVWVYRLNRSNKVHPGKYATLDRAMVKAKKHFNILK